MNFRNIEYILFDAANTLIHKPRLWTAIISVLNQHGYNIPISKLMLHHKLLSEVTNFPDKTSREFYNKFNSELLMSFGIIPSEKILADIFDNCTYLPWERFEDTFWLKDFKLPTGVLSNFNNSLPKVLDNLFGNTFTDIIVSENTKIRKPDLLFFQHALDVIKLDASKILYVGDSLKLDIIPANKIGFQVILIDRIELFSGAKESIKDLNQMNIYF